jgi:membrane protease subunit HflK
MGPLPDLDQLIARLQAYVRSLLGGGPRGRFTGGRGLALIAIGVAALWLASGIYRVQPDEQGVVLRFGAFNRMTLPGLNYHLPWPIERVETPAVTRINRIEIGYRSAGGARIETDNQGGRTVLEESLMLTGDENIIDINFAVFWRINDAVGYLFNTRNPPLIIKAVAESVMREVIGRTPIQPALTELRAQIETDVLRQTQQILNNYKTGVEITQVQLQKVDPPAEVVESFLDVQRANTDAERLRNEAEAYHNDIVPRARGDAARIVAEGQGARQASIAQATGQTQRFLSVLAAYQAAREVTLRRMYLETMQDILTHSPSLVVDDKLKGLVPFLPLSPPNPASPIPAVPPAPNTAAQQGAPR